MRRVLYVSGTRADYGPARRTLKTIAARPGLSLGILVTGMHLDPHHGETWKEIKADGFEILERVPAPPKRDSTALMGVSYGRLLEGIAPAIGRTRPDILLVLGDRGEQLMAAIAGALQNVLVVHLCGGSLSGSIDDSIRHAVTKFAHYHLVACDADRERVVQMGEDPETVRTVGLPGADIRQDVRFTREEVLSFVGLPPGAQYVLVVQHAVTHSSEAARSEISETLEAVVELGLPALLCNPNDDAGGRAIMEVMGAYAGRHPTLRVLPPPGSREMYASVMAHAAVQVGNSSSGIVEAGSVALPVVNVGERQRGRENLGRIINAPHERKQIHAALRRCLSDEDYRRGLREWADKLATAPTESLIADELETLNLGRAAKPKRFHVTTKLEAIHDPGCLR